MKEPNPKDFDLTENLINWYPKTWGGKERFNWNKFPRMFSRYSPSDIGSTIGSFFPYIGFFLFCYLTWEVGGVINIINDQFEDKNLKGFLLFSPIISGFITFSTIPKLIRVITLFLLKKHEENILKYDLECEKYYKFRKKQETKEKKLFLLNELEKLNFNFPLFDESNLSNLSKKLIKDCWKKLTDLEKYHNKKFEDNSPKDIYKDLTKYRDKKIQNSFINLIGICHIMGWEDLRNIVYTLGIVLPNYDRRYSQEIEIDYRKKKCDEFQEELKKLQYELWDFSVRRLEVDPWIFRDRKFLEMTKMVKFLDYLTSDDKIFNVGSFQKIVQDVLPPSNEIDLNFIFNKKPLFSHLFDKDKMTLYDRRIKRL